MKNFNLPPGVSLRDIELQRTKCSNCDGIGCDDCNDTGYTDLQSKREQVEEMQYQAYKDKELFQNE